MEADECWGFYGSVHVKGSSYERHKTIPLADGLEVLRSAKNHLFFTWEATWGRILTFDKLQRRGISLVNRCFLCQEADKLVDHLLLHCSKTRVLWELLFFLFGVN